MHTSPGLHLAAASRGKRGAARGNAQRGTRQRGRWNGAPTGRGGKSLANAYPSQPSRTLANVIRFQKRVSSHY